MTGPAGSLRRIDKLIQEFRRRAGMTQQQAAELAGVSLAGLRDLEQGRVAKPRVATLRRLATALALSADETDELIGLSLNTQIPGYDLWVQVLGPLSAQVAGAAVDPGSARRRMLLGLLALAPNEPVARDSLLEWLWDSEPPETAVALLQTDVSRLRRRLLPRKPDASANRLVIATQSGYQLTLGDQQLDLLAFRKLASAAAESRKQGDLVGACEQFKQAVNLWRGEPLTNLPALRVHPATVALGRERQALVLDYASTAGELGRHSEVLPFLRDVAESDPLHENIHAALMIALAGSGQQAAALSVFTDLRNRLATELGADPGHELAQAHQRVLRHDLTRSEQPATATRAHRQLPRDIADFTGRETELSVLQARAARNAEHHTATTIANIVGMAGVGKTRLAVRLAHQLLAAGKYGDQQLYVDLHGHAPQPPADPNTVLASFLHLLDVPGDQIPQDLDSRAALYRDRLHGKNALVLLDNAATA
ncbi:DNA-binding transcriptional activator of the SARP family, partial [Prauserella marina]